MVLIMLGPSTVLMAGAVQRYGARQLSLDKRHSQIWQCRGNPTLAQIWCSISGCSAKSPASELTKSNAGGKVLANCSQHQALLALAKLVRFRDKACSSMLLLAACMHGQVKAATEPMCWKPRTKMLLEALLLVTTTTIAKAEGLGCDDTETSVPECHMSVKAYLS